MIFQHRLAANAFRDLPWRIVRDRTVSLDCIALAIVPHRASCASQAGG